MLSSEINASKLGVRHTLTAPISDLNDACYEHRTDLVDAFSGVELSRNGHEITVTFVLPLEANFYGYSDPEDEHSPFAVLAAIGFNRYQLVMRCQSAQHTVSNEDSRS